MLALATELMVRRRADGGADATQLDSSGPFKIFPFLAPDRPLGSSALRPCKIRLGRFNFCCSKTSERKTSASKTGRPLAQQQSERKWRLTNENNKRAGEQRRKTTRQLACCPLLFTTKRRDFSRPRAGARACERGERVFGAGRRARWGSLTSHSGASRGESSGALVVPVARGRGASTPSRRGRFKLCPLTGLVLGCGRNAGALVCCYAMGLFGFQLVGVEVPLVLVCVARAQKHLGDGARM